ncbi:unnamed protein product [Lymnaea stagnalis]|uniref:Centromere/kinetochore protein zw10 homolog n=1 Tax=Lymnaea stagnalis TaxID=6523 RepID=A0AAV2HMF1_LYMST
MTSFVGKILEHAGQMEQKAIHEKLDVLTRSLSELEVEVHQLAESKYINFRNSVEETERLHQEVQSLHSEISSIETRINNEVKGKLSLSTGDFQSLNEEVEKKKTIIEGLAYLSEIGSLLKDCDEALRSGEYSKAAAALLRLEMFLKQPLCDDDDTITVILSMRTELKVQKGKLESMMSDLWVDAIKWTVMNDQKSGLPPREVSMSVSTDVNLRELVEGLHRAGLLERRMNAFSERFHNHLLPMILEAGQLQIELKNNTANSTLTLATKDSKKSPVGASEEKTYASVFSHLLDVLTQLDKILLHFDFGWEIGSDPNSPGHLSKKGTLMSLLGQDIAPSLLDLLQRTVLAKAVPTSAKDLGGFNAVIAATKLFESELKRLGFIPLENNTLMNHVQNINMLFANKKSQIIIEEARDLMLSDLHDTVAVADDKPVGEWPPLTPGGVKKGKGRDVVSENQISDYTLRMPKCRISQSTEALMKLAYETLSEATGNPECVPECAVQMFFAVKSMFEMFLDVVSTHHIHRLETVPQFSAVHLNNCMYIAHHLETMGHQFAPKLPGTFTSTFLDLVDQLRSSGVEIFRSQVIRQEKLLLEYLNGADGFTKLEDSDNWDKAKKSVDQVIFQLKHLQKIWKPVLPINIYKKATGMLIQHVVQIVTDSILSLEDISQGASTQLISILSTIETNCGECLTSPGEVASVELTRHVKSWQRLTEIKLVVDSSLSAISDRWAEGKGPLAASLKAIELKNLIRALFQNTDRRADVLAAIK